MSNKNILSVKNWYLWKIGISNAPKLRAQQVSDSIQERSGKPFPIKIWLSIPLFSARFIETKAHGLFQRFRSKRVPHGSSGYTEWFTAPNSIISLLLYFLLPDFEGKSALCLAVFLAPIPFDFMAVCIGMAAAELFLAAFVLCKAIELVFGVDLMGGTICILKYLAQ
jgi:hypothetical protein